MRLFKLALILALPLCVQAAQGPVMPTTPFKFTKNLGSLPGGTIDVDTSTMTAVDGPEGRMVGAIIRVTLKQGVSTPLGPEAFTFINAIVASCKKDYISLLASRLYGINGNQLLTLPGVRNFPRTEQNETPTDLSFAFFCTQKIPSTPIGSNTLPDSYKSFWK